MKPKPLSLLNHFTMLVAVPTVIPRESHVEIVYSRLAKRKARIIKKEGAQCKKLNRVSIATGLFVSLVLAFARDAGEDENKEIKINGGDQRDITIHAAKGKS